MKIHVQPFVGEAAERYLPDLARLRLEVFRDFPYLYDGNMDYERAYLQTYVERPDSVLVIAFDGEAVIGASTALPMKYETPHIQQPFLDKQYDVSQVFYFGESVLKKAYRGHGIGVAFFQQREAYARQLGGFRYLTFCGVIRPDEHPLRPTNYVPLDNFWLNRGFQPTEMVCYMDWKDLNEPAESSKPLRFWIKPL